MAVGKSKTSRARRDKRRRANTKLFSASNLRLDSTTGEAHRSHHITASGMYKGKKVIDNQD